MPVNLVFKLQTVDRANEVLKVRFYRISITAYDKNKRKTEEYLILLARSANEKRARRFSKILFAP